MDFKDLNKYVTSFDFTNFINRNIDEIFLDAEDIKKIIQSSGKGWLYIDREDYGPIEQIEDNYEYYKKKWNKGITLNNFKFLEGKKIYDTWINYMHDSFPLFKFVDIHDFYNLSFSDLVIKTISILSCNDNVVVLNPIFFNNKNAIATPDAIVKYNNKIYLVMLKGICDSKKIHFLEYSYFCNVINPILKFHNLQAISDNVLCLIQYNLTSRLNITISSTNNTSVISVLINTPHNTKFNDDEEIYQHENITEKRIKKELKNGKFLTFGQVFNMISMNYFSSFRYKKDIFDKFIYNIQEVFSNNNFNNIIDSIYSVIDNKNKNYITNYQASSSKNDIVLNFIPTIKYFSWWQYNPYFPYLCKVYHGISDEKYEIFNFSHKLISYEEKISFFNNNDNINEYLFLLFDNKKKIEKVTNRFQRYMSLVEQKDKPWLVTQDAYDHFNKITDKRLFLTFTTISIATSAFDNTIPFDNVVVGMHVMSDTIRNCDHNIIIDLYTKIDPKDEYMAMIQYINDIIINNKDTTIIVYEKQKIISALKYIMYILDDNTITDQCNLIISLLLDYSDFFNIDCDYSVIVKSLCGNNSLNKVMNVFEQYYAEDYNQYSSQLFFSDSLSDVSDYYKDRLYGLLNDQQWINAKEKILAFTYSYLKNVQAAGIFLVNILNVAKD